MGRDIFAGSVTGLLAFSAGCLATLVLRQPVTTASPTSQPDPPETAPDADAAPVSMGVVDTPDDAGNPDDQVLKTSKPKPVSYLWSLNFLKNVLAGVVASAVFWSLTVLIGAWTGLFKDNPTLDALFKISNWIGAAVFTLMLVVLIRQLVTEQSRTTKVLLGIVAPIVFALAAVMAYTAAR